MGLGEEEVFSSVLRSRHAFDCIYFIFYFLKIYLFMRERERQRHRQREKQDPHREPDVGLDPGYWDHALS